jgi:uncharacterized repeat protein (TIGR01451 family)
LTDSLPPALEVVTVPSGCTTRGTAIACTVGTLPAGASRSFSLVTRPTAAAAGRTFTNIAVSSSARPDARPANNAARATISVGGLADLAVTKAVSPDPLTAGGRGTYTIVVANKGPTGATAVLLGDPLPAGLTAVSAKPSHGACSIASGGHVSCRLGALAAGADAQVVIVAHVGASLAGRTLANSVEISSATPDPDPGNDRGTSSTRVLPVPRRVASPAPPPRIDLSARVEARERLVRTDGLLRYTIVAANLSGATAHDVRLTSTLDSPAVLVSERLGAPRVAAGAGAQKVARRCGHALPLVCTLGRLGPHATVRIDLVVKPLLPRPLVNTVSIGGIETDPRLANNKDAVAVRVLAARAVVVVTKRADRQRVRGGATVHYTIRVRSTGTTAALAVRVCDRLPSDQVYAAVDGAAYRNGEACWTISRLAPRAGRQFTVSAIVDLAAGSHRSTNTVRVVGANFPARLAAAGVNVIRVPGRPGGAGG